MIDNFRFTIDNDLFYDSYNRKFFLAHQFLIGFSDNNKN